MAIWKLSYFFDSFHGSFITRSDKKWMGFFPAIKQTLEKKASWCPQWNRITFIKILLTTLLQGISVSHDNLITFTPFVTTFNLVSVLFLLRRLILLHHSMNSKDMAKIWKRCLLMDANYFTLFHLLDVCLAWRNSDIYSHLTAALYQWNDRKYYHSTIENISDHL